MELGRLKVQSYPELCFHRGEKTNMHTLNITIPISNLKLFLSEQHTVQPSFVMLASNSEEGNSFPSAWKSPGTQLRARSELRL